MSLMPLPKIHIPPQQVTGLIPINMIAKEIWQRAHWPTKKMEAWRFTSLKALEQGNYFENYGVLPKEAELKGLSPHFNIPNLDAYRLVFVNGCYSPAHSTLNQIPENIDLVSFSRANDHQIEIVQQHLGKIVDLTKSIFSTLNTQTFNDGVLLRVGKNTALDKPIQIVSLTTASEHDFHSAQRLLVIMEPFSQAEIIEQFVTTTEQQNCFVHSVTEMYLAKNANCQYYRLHLEEQHSIHLGGIYAELAQNAQLGTFQLSLGGHLKRTDTNIFHRGEGSNSNLKGIYLPKLNQCIDMHTNVEHIVPRCTSEQTFRGVVGDNARAVFNGRIHIHPKAQKTSAHLSNKNLLTSEKAEIYTKPELEIYADDVKCSHGATVAQMNDEALHYFCARGISHATAKIMLSQGFVNELLEGITIPALVEYLRPIIATWFEANQFAELTQLNERELLV